jgi:hypothetical protein
VSGCWSLIIQRLIMKPFSESQLAKLREMRPTIDEAFESIVKILISADLLETEKIDDIVEDWNEVIDFYIRENQERKQ